VSSALEFFSATMHYINQHYLSIYPSIYLSIHPDDLKSNKLISTESVNTSQNRPLWKLLVALRKPDDDEDEEEEDNYEDDDNDEEDDDDHVVMIH